MDLGESSPEEAGGGGQGIAEHYIAISLKQADVACYLKNGTVRRLLGHKDELCDAFPQLLAGSRGIASENVCELLRLPLREVAHLFNRELRHLRLDTSIAKTLDLGETRFNGSKLG